jgi:hypothetical protein
VITDSISIWQLRPLICVAANFLFPPVPGKQQQQKAYLLHYKHTRPDSERSNHLKFWAILDFTPLKAGQRAVQAQLEPLDIEKEEA